MPIFASPGQPFRQFKRQPLYAFSVAATLALAVVAATATTAVVKRAFFDPLPYRNPDELVSLLTLIDGQTWAVSAPVLEDLRSAGAPIAEYGPIDPEAVTYSDGESSEVVPAAYTTSSFFSTVGVQPVVGQMWREGNRQSAIVTWKFWHEELGGTADALTRPLRINGVDHVVSGVLPEGFVPPYFATASVWLPLDMQPLMAGSGRARRTLTVIARLSPGATLGQLNARLEVFTKQLQLQHPQIHGRQSWVARDLREEMIGSAKPVVLGTGAATVLLLVLVCANVAGLAAARAVGMRHQIAVRHALGATRARLLRERLAESLALGVVGSVAGLWLGDLVIDLVATFQSQFMPRLATVSLDAGGAAVGVATAVVCSLLAAIIPHGSGTGGGIEMLRAARYSSGSPAVARTRSMLVVAQVAVALVLVVGAGLIVRTVHHLSSAPLGFDPEGLTTFTATLPVPKYADEARQVQFEREVLERLQSIPGVQAPTASVGFPVVGGVRASLSIIGRSDETGRGEIAYMSMAPGFLETVGMRVLAGRDLTAADAESAPLVTLINETMAKQYWPQGDALGAKVRIGPGTGGPVITIVGIVADVSYHGPTQPVIPAAFGSTYQYSWPRRHFTVRADAGVTAIAADLRAAVRAVDPDVPLGPFQTVGDMVSNQTMRHRLVMFVLTFFGAIATILSAFGLYAVVALTSQLRRREYAIRLALGAPRGDVRWMVLRQALLLAVAGVAIGLLVAALGTGVLRALLHGVTPLDGATFASACVAVLGLAIAAASWPALTAGRVDPVEALQAE
jgi:predicted permease